MSVKPRRTERLIDMSSSLPSVTTPSWRHDPRGYFGRLRLARLTRASSRMPLQACDLQRRCSDPSLRSRRPSGAETKDLNDQEIDPLPPILQPLGSILPLDGGMTASHSAPFPQPSQMELPDSEQRRAVEPERNPERVLSDALAAHHDGRTRPARGIAEPDAHARPHRDRRDRITGEPPWRAIEPIKLDQHTEVRTERKQRGRATKPPARLTPAVKSELRPKASALGPPIAERPLRPPRSRRPG